MNIHREIYFEDEIIDHLTAHGWLLGTNDRYDAEKALYTEDALAWVQMAYPKEWDKLKATHGEEASKIFINRLVAELEGVGSLSVLRHGFKMAGLGSTRMAMATFKPATDLNELVMLQYSGVKCRVVRQVHYSPFRRAESIDLVLLVNGIPVSTLELKTQSTQTVFDAIKQYKFDRPVIDPIQKTKEPLLQFKTRCVVHFAVSTEEVWMCSKLAGAQSVFLPFNLGDAEGAGNPLNPNGCKTAYLWEQVLQRDHFLQILAKFVHLKVDEKEDARGVKSTSESLIFPRFHQWDGVTHLLDAVKEEGVGKRYLIQHSAGSGKSNSIAWLAHHLSTLHNAQNEKMFDSVIVITDRTVLDKQLQDTIYQFEHKQGMVERVTNDREGSKSSQVLLALEERKPIIIVTIQTFSRVLELIENSQLKTGAYAVIADEAHSSQTGSASAALKRVLGEKQDLENIDMEDIITAMATSRVGSGNLSYFAFTATPKTKTMQLFGRPDENGTYKAFHVYSMRQAIEEGFILDVLKGYLNYKVAYKLAHNGQMYDEDMVDKSEASKALSKWVRLHPYNISQKVKVIVEHFRENVAHRLEGEAKAMVVTSSRQEAVRYKIAIDKYIKEMKYSMGTLVAFSGEVVDPEMGDLPFTEVSLNPTLKGADIRDAFDGSSNHFLIVANKYQTGFDQPKLVAMYLDKRLSGVATVQTLSRLNRTYKGKDWTVVLDFANTPESILEDFQQYYRGCTLSDATDPNKLYTLQDKLDSDGLYTEGEVEDFANSFFAVKAGQKMNHNKLRALLGPIVQRFAHRVKQAKVSGESKSLDELKILVKDVQSFCKLYDFLSQIIDFGDNDLEKRFVLFKHLTHDLYELLKTEPLVDLIDLKQLSLTHHAIKKMGTPSLTLDPTAESELEGIGDQGTKEARDREQVKLSELVQKLNDLFEGELTDQDLVNWATGLRDKILEDAELAIQAEHNTKDQFAEGKFRDTLKDSIIDFMGVNQTMATQALSNNRTFEGLFTMMLGMVYEGFQNKRQQGGVGMPG